MRTVKDIIDYWYSDALRPHWFSSTPELDCAIRERFEAVWETADRGDLEHWRSSAEGCLALAIVFDQLPLNMFRGQLKSMQTEHKAIAVTKHAIAKGYDNVLPTEQLLFLYIPLMHSERLVDQDESVRLFYAAKLHDQAQFAEHHRALIQRFGRFPHRNAMLSRQSTQEERDYLNSKQAFLG